MDMWSSLLKDVIIKSSCMDHQPIRITWKWAMRYSTLTNANWKICHVLRWYGTFMRYTLMMWYNIIYTIPWTPFCTNSMELYQINPTHTQIIFTNSLIQCIQSCVIKLRVKRRTDAKLGKCVNSNYDYVFEKVGIECNINGDSFSNKMQKYRASHTLKSH